MMTSAHASIQYWPPFSLKQIPLAFRPSLVDYLRRPIHALSGQRPEADLLTIVVPCFNPRPDHFLQFLLSLEQQTDPRFALVLVDDATSDPESLFFLQHLQRLGIARVLRHRTNQGIASALNHGVQEVHTSYVALVDQDDLLHPRAVEIVRSYLKRNPECQFLYTDHIAFYDGSLEATYVPKFPWNPSALREFNYPIHLTVVSRESYVAVGGMDSAYDGIQDWEFYLRLSRLLSPAAVRYLPQPLYAWRLSDQSVARSGRPRVELRNLALQFVEREHKLDHRGCRTDNGLRHPGHYFFATDRSACETQGPLHCPPVSGVVFATGTNPGDLAALADTLQSLFSTDLPLVRVLVASAGPDLPPAFHLTPGLLPHSSRLAFGDPAAFLAEVPDDHALFVIAGGCRLEPGTQLRPLLAWLSGSPYDLLTLPVEGEDGKGCLHAGLACVGDTLLLPQGQGLKRSDYAADFASYGHSRSVDAVSPWNVLVRAGCLSRILTSPTLANPAPLTDWYCRLHAAGLDAVCLPEPWVRASEALATSTRDCLLEIGPVGLRWLPPRDWPYRHPGLRKLDFTALQSLALRGAAPRSHPSATADFLLTRYPLLPGAESKNAEWEQVPFQLPLRDLFLNGNRRPLVLLIPTELNPRSNGHNCMLTLAINLQEMGFEISLLPFQPYRFFAQYFASLQPEYQRLRYIIHPDEAPGSLLIAPDAAPPTIVRSLRRHFDTVLWWLLAPSGLLTDFHPDIRVGDLMIPFSSFVLPGQADYLFVHPREHEAIRRTYRRHLPHRPGVQRVALYTGKGRLKPLPRHLHRRLLAYEIHLITRSHPTTKHDLIELLNCCRGLISFDPMTNLSLEAASLGLPVYLPGNPFPSSCFDDFPVELRTHLTDNPDVFLRRMEDPGPVRRLSTKHLVKKNREAAATIAMLASGSVASMAYRVSSRKLRRLAEYRRELVSSRTIQATYDGQALSSALTHLYLHTMKLPYDTHVLLCRCLFYVDSVADFLGYLGIFRALQPAIRRIGSLILAVGRIPFPSHPS